MNASDLKTKCSRAMLESGPDVKVKLTVPRPWDLESGAKAVGLGMDRNGGPMAQVVREAEVGGKKMLDVHIKAAVLLKAVQDLEKEQ